MTDSDQLWFYHVNSERHGPLPEAQMIALVQAGTIDGDTPVWTEGMAGWQPLRTTPLGGRIAAPPLPGASSEATVFAPRASLPAAVTPAASSGGAGASAPRPEPVFSQPGAQTAVNGMNEAVRGCLNKYATFSGRASRPEYWWFALAYFLAAIATSIVDQLLPIGIFTIILVLAALLPSISVMVRRLHDTDRSGWWYWIMLVPLIGIVVLVVFLCQPGTPGPNRYGPKP